MKGANTGIKFFSNSIRIVYFAKSFHFNATLKNRTKLKLLMHCKFYFAFVENKSIKRILFAEINDIKISAYFVNVLYISNSMRLNLYSLFLKWTINM